MFGMVKMKKKIEIYIFDDRSLANISTTRLSARQVCPQLSTKIITIDEGQIYVIQHTKIQNSIQNTLVCQASLPPSCQQSYLCLLLIDLYIYPQTSKFSLIMFLIPKKDVSCLRDLADKIVHYSKANQQLVFIFFSFICREHWQNGY